MGTSRSSHYPCTTRKIRGCLKKNNVIKSKLPVMWRANSKAWVTRQCFIEWIHEVFAPSVKKYLQENNLLLKCLLMMDNAPAHPPGLADELMEKLDFITVKFLPPNRPGSK